jgi:SAM-dependent MidA family methyltransferase
VSPFEPALRREPPPDLDVGAEPQLVERLRAEIVSSGPITFARFMERALYEPGLGYYRSAESRPGRAGDFLTAPETHPIFGRAVGRQLDEVWRIVDRPDPFVVREYGAGSGALATSVLAGLVADGSGLRDALRYEPVEVEHRRFAEIEERLGPGARDIVRQPSHDPIVGCVLANEVLDALPVHRVVRRGSELREILVDFRNGRFVDVEGDPSSSALAERLATEDVELADGQRAEICLALGGWIDEAARGLGTGLLLLIDYGHAAAELYGPKRMAGTLRAYVRHRVHDDVLANVGRQDLTAHVDLTAVERAAARAGLELVGSTTQAEFLVGLGVGDMLESVQADPATTLESYLELRSALGRLLDPAATGAFRVMGFGRGLPRGLELRGFAYRLRRDGLAGPSRTAPD